MWLRADLHNYVRHAHYATNEGTLQLTVLDYHWNALDDRQPYASAQQ